MSIRDTACLLLALALGPTGAAQQVLTVADSGAGDFTTLEAAVSAAAPGDTVLVIEEHAFSAYGYVSVEKALTIAAAPGVQASVRQVIVEGLSAEEQVTLRGLQVGVGPFMNKPPIILRGNAGTVWIEECVTPATVVVSWGLCIPGEPGLLVEDCDAVYVLDSLIHGQDGYSWQGSFSCPDGMPGGPGARIVRSRVSFHGVDLIGGSSGEGDLGPDGKSGGAGLEGLDATLVCSDVSLVGGEGGSLCSSPFAAQCAGGDGLVLEGATTLHALDSTWAGGAGLALSDGGNAPDGEALSVTPSDTILAWPGDARALAISSPVPEGGLASLRYEGQPGDLLGLFLADDPAFAVLAGKLGTFALGAPLLGPLVVVPVAPDGTFDLDFTVGNLVLGGHESTAFVGQALVRKSNGHVVLSRPTEFTVYEP